MTDDLWKTDRRDYYPEAEIKYTKRGPYIPPVLDKDYSALDPELKTAMVNRLAMDELERRYKAMARWMNEHFIRDRLTDDEFDDDMFSQENGDGSIY